MTFLKTLAVGTFLASTLIAGGALAKGHDQGAGPNGTQADGTVKSVTVATARILGSVRGNSTNAPGQNK